VFRRADFSTKIWAMSRPVAHLVDVLLEVSVVGSFSRVGYLVRKATQDWEDPPSMFGKRAVVTGASSGVGRACALAFGRLGAEVWVLGRDEGRTDAVAEEIRTGGGRAHAAIVDMADGDAIAEWCTQFAGTHDRLNALVHSAGALLRDYRASGDGVEMTVATHVLAPFRLTWHLAPLLQRAGSETGAGGAGSAGDVSDVSGAGDVSGADNVGGVGGATGASGAAGTGGATGASGAAGATVVIVSSGGMYTERFDIDRLEMPPTRYDGVRAYARAKRAQVVLSGEWARRWRSRGIASYAMHPGWVDTPGLASGLPSFAHLGPLLRRPSEGADTAVWLAAGAARARGVVGEGTVRGRGGAARARGEGADDGFWHDRRRRSAYYLPWTRPRPVAARGGGASEIAAEERDGRALWDWCAARAGLGFEQ
jgi:dehydrogenase/reductase SDR family protein 12